MVFADSDDQLQEDDGLPYPTVGAWAIEKHRKIAYYASIFADSMRKKWNCRWYIDLYAGAGAAKLKGTDHRIKGSPLHVLGIEVPFDKYIFCEENPELSRALEERIKVFHPEANACVLKVNCNRSIDQICTAIPQFGPGNTGIGFCFVDPFNASNLEFETIRRLATNRYVDFAVLIPSHMDIHRNAFNYTKPDCPIIDNLLGESQWRIDWAAVNSASKDFGLFVADRFGKRMKSCGYIYEGPECFEKIRMGEDFGLNLYYICFFSRHPRGQQFWKETRNRTKRQMTLGI